MDKKEQSMKIHTNEVDQPLQFLKHNSENEGANMVMEAFRNK